MNRRFRSLAALLALLALSLFWVEGLWASMCTADMEMRMPVAASVADDGAAPAGSGAAEQSGHSHEQDRDGSRPDCPLTLAGAASCTGGVALLPPSAVPEVGPAEDEFAVASSDHAKDLLLAVSLLRPPRA